MTLAPMTGILSSPPRRGIRWRRVCLVAAYVSAVLCHNRARARGSAVAARRARTAAAASWPTSQPSPTAPPSSNGHVLLVHQTGKSGETERGTSALRGLVQTMLELVGDDGVATLSSPLRQSGRQFTSTRQRESPAVESTKPQ